MVVKGSFCGEYRSLMDLSAGTTSTNEMTSFIHLLNPSYQFRTILGNLSFKFAKESNLTSIEVTLSILQDGQRNYNRTAEIPK
jgi:hypothetical protein